MKLDLKSLEYMGDPLVTDVFHSHAKGMNHLLDCLQLLDNRIRKCEEKLRERSKSE